MSEGVITLQEVVEDAIRAAIRELPIMIPAKVVKWDSSKGRVDCQILIKQVISRDEVEDGSRQAFSWPVVPACPVQFMGSAGFRLTCPISDGNLVINGVTIPATIGSLLFSHRSLDKWLAGTGSEVDPEFDHDHQLTDGVFTPGLLPFGAFWKNVPSSKMSIGNDTSPSDIEIDTQGNVVIANGSQGAARNQDPVDLGQWLHVPAAGAGVTPCKMIWAPAGGSTGSFQSLDNVLVDITGNIKSASTKVKIG